MRFMANVFDHGHVLGAEAGSQAGQVVVEDDIEDPMQAIFDVPMTADGAGEETCVEACRRKEVARSPGFAIPLDFGLDHGDGD